MVFVFTVTRADTDDRIRMFHRTLKQARERAGMPFHWYVAYSGVQPITADNIDTSAYYPYNVGQHVAWNDAYRKAYHDHYTYFVRVDDDIEFLTHKWLRKLVNASEALNDEMILSPKVKGLIHPPERSDPVTHNGVNLSFLLNAIAGQTRLHPMALLDRYKYVSDVRRALGAGDATGIAQWCQENMIPMAWVNSIRIRHATRQHIERDPQHFSNHDLFQLIPYIPPYKEAA